MITQEEFICAVYEAINNRPTCWRKGQACFNFIESKYHVGRIVQFDRHVDCFYNDNAIDEFVQLAWEEVKEKLNNN